jgi:hypothetical protein
MVESLPWRTYKSTNEAALLTSGAFRINVGAVARPSPAIAERLLSGGNSAALKVGPGSGAGTLVAPLLGGYPAQT